MLVRWQAGQEVCCNKRDYDFRSSAYDMLFSYFHFLALTSVDYPSFFLFQLKKNSCCMEQWDITNSTTRQTKRIFQSIYIQKQICNRIGMWCCIIKYRRGKIRCIVCTCHGCQFGSTCIGTTEYRTQQFKEQQQR